MRVLIPEQASTEDGKQSTKVDVCGDKTGIVNFGRLRGEPGSAAINHSTVTTLSQPRHGGEIDGTRPRDWSPVCSSCGLESQVVGYSWGAVRTRSSNAARGGG